MTHRTSAPHRSQVAETVRSRTGLTALVGIALLLSSCGSTVAPGGIGAPPPATGPQRVVSAQPTGADGALECPATISDQRGLTVPASPEGLDGNARLLPEREPSTVVTCRYPVLDDQAGSLSAPFALRGRTVLTGEPRTRLVETLTWAPRASGAGKACTQIGGNETAYLVGVTYPDAVVWVAGKADPNSCSDATNGDFLSRASVGNVVDAIVDGPDAVPTGAGSSDPMTVCAWSGFGRLGDDRSLAPDGDPVVTVCRSAADGSQAPTALTADQSREVVTALRGLAVTTSTSTRVCDTPDWSRYFRLVLTYPSGPSVWVEVTPYCDVQVWTSALQATDAGPLLHLVEQWSGPIPGYDPDTGVSSTS